MPFWVKNSENILKIYFLGLPLRVALFRALVLCTGTPCRPVHRSGKVVKGLNLQTQNNIEVYQRQVFKSC